MSYSKDSINKKLTRYNKRLAHYIRRLGAECEVCGSSDGLTIDRKVDALRKSPKPSYALLHSDAEDIRDYLRHWYLICSKCKAEGRALRESREVEGDPKWKCVCGAEFHESGRYKSHCGNCKIRKRYKDMEEEDE